jgi:hypothetical protein
MTGRTRIRFRSPGVKPGQRIGPLGPFRGRLGLHWVIAPVVLAAVLLVAGWYFLAGSRPGDPWRAVGRVDRLAPGAAGPVGAGIFLARLVDGRAVAVAEDPGCGLEVVPGQGYEDCEGADFDLEGHPLGGGEALDLVPLRLHRGEIFIDPGGRIER